jgi:hypothetical protein
MFQPVSNHLEFIFRERFQLTRDPLLEHDIDVACVSCNVRHFILIPAEQGDYDLEFRQHS